MLFSGVNIISYFRTRNTVTTYKVAGMKKRFYLMTHSTHGVGCIVDDQTDNER